uniref:BPTI/Kunitz inhibitor domain-containing protein n=1 Tax=Nothoprocta perdicaria TaxID=30464 RepID=A0A8C6Z017_NOTPE
MLWGPAPAAIAGARPDPLLSPRGECRRYTLRWYYNQRAAECRPFVYGGCRGGTNRFESREDCERLCGRRA